MFPNTNQQPHVPAELPSVPQPVPAQQAGIPVQQQPASAVPPTGPVTSAQEHDVAMQAKRLVAQYGNDPYRLATAFSQLKAEYLAGQYRITPNRAEQ